MGPDTRTRCTTLARCWRGSCYGFGFAASTIFMFVMMWLLWCYVGLVSLPTTEPQRRALVHYAVTTPKPAFTTPSVNSTAPSQMSTLNSIPSASRSQSTPLRGNSRGEAQVVRQEVSPTVRTEDAKGDFNGRESLAKPASNSTAVRSKGTSSESSADSRYDNERQRSSSMDSIIVRSVSSSAPENLADSKEVDRRGEKPVMERGKTEPRDYEIETVDKGRRITEVLPARTDDYDDDRSRPRRPADRDLYDDTRPSRDYDTYDKGRPSSRDYLDKDRMDRDRRVIDSKDTREEPISSRVDDRGYDRRLDDRDRPRYDRDRDSYDYPRRRYEDLDDEARLPSRRRTDDDIRLRDVDRETSVRRVDDDYYRSRPATSRDERYRDRYDEDRLRGDAPYRDRTKDDAYLGTEDRYRDRKDDRYKSRLDDRYVDDKNERYRPVDDDGYRRDRYSDDDRYIDRTLDDRYRRRNDRDEDRYADRPVVDDRYRTRADSETTSRRDDIRPRGDSGTYRDEIEPRRTMDVLPVSRDVQPLPPVRDPVESRTRDDIDRRDSLRKDTHDDLPPRSIDEDRYRAREDDRRRPPPLNYDNSKDDYVPRDKDSASDLEGYRYRERSRPRDDPRYDDDDTVRRRTRPRYDSEIYRPKGEEDIDDERYRRRRLEERPLPRDPVPRRDEDYRGSREPVSKGDERVLDRDSPIYLAEDKDLSKNIRTKPEDVTLDRRSYASMDDDYTRNRPRSDPKLSTDRDDLEDRYRPSRRRVTEVGTDYVGDRYDGRSRDRYDTDDYRSRDYDRGYDRTEDRRYSRTDTRDLIRPAKPDPEDRVRDVIQPSRTIPDDRPVRSSSRDTYPAETRPYAGDSRPSRIDDEYPRRDSTYDRPTETRSKREPAVLESSISRNPIPTNIREKRYQEPDEPCISARSDDASRSYRTGCVKSSRAVASSPSRPSTDTRDLSERPLTPKEVIEAAYRHRDVPDRPGSSIYPVYDPRIHNMTSPEIIRPNERRGTTITTRKKKK